MDISILIRAFTDHSAAECDHDMTAYCNSNNTQSIELGLVAKMLWLLKCNNH